MQNTYPWRLLHSEQAAAAERTMLSEGEEVIVTIIGLGLAAAAALALAGPAMAQRYEPAKARSPRRASRTSRRYALARSTGRGQFAPVSKTTRPRSVRSAQRCWIRQAPAVVAEARGSADPGADDLARPYRSPKASARFRFEVDMTSFRAARFTTFALVALTIVPAFAADSSMADLKSTAAGLTAQYAHQLKSALGASLEANGPFGALEVCHSAAPAIASDLSRTSGWTVARTSLKPRNAVSAPDAYERWIMRLFETRIGFGEKAADLVSAEIVDQTGGKVFRFVKAIPTDTMCLTCHGADIQPDLRQKISELYPKDKATGFKVGEIRGVFTLSKRLNDGKNN
jgi:hypothetical protein